MDYFVRKRPTQAERRRLLGVALSTALATATGVGVVVYYFGSILKSKRRLPGPGSESSAEGDE